MGSLDVEQQVATTLEEIKDEVNYSIEYRLLSLKKIKEEFLEDLNKWKLCQFDDKNVINEFKKVKLDAKKDPNKKYNKLQEGYVKDLEDKLSDKDVLFFKSSDLKFLKNMNDGNQLTMRIGENRYDINKNSENPEKDMESLYEKLRDKQGKLRSYDLPIYILKDIYKLNNQPISAPTYNTIQTQFDTISDIYYPVNNVCSL